MGWKHGFREPGGDHEREHNIRNGFLFISEKIRVEEYCFLNGDFFLPSLISLYVDVITMHISLNATRKILIYEFAFLLSV